MRLVLLIISVLLFSTYMLADTRKIHLFKIFDYENHEPREASLVKNACKTISAKTKLEINYIHSELSTVDVREYEFSGSKFDQKILMNTIKSLKFIDNDIIFIIYVGHGRRHVAQDNLQQTPLLKFNDQSEIEFETLREMFLEKKPSYIISMIIACNAPSEFQPKGRPFIRNDSVNDISYNHRNIVLSSVKKRYLAPYLSLFQTHKNYTTCIDLLAAKANYYTFIDSHGGNFFWSIMDAFETTFSQNQTLEWKDFFKIAKEKYKKNTSLEEEPDYLVTTYHKSLPGNTIKKNNIIFKKLDPRCKKEYLAMERTLKKEYESQKTLYKKDLQRFKDKEKTMSNKAAIKRYNARLLDLRSRYKEQLKRKFLSCS